MKKSQVSISLISDRLERLEQSIQVSPSGRRRFKLDKELLMKDVDICFDVAGYLTMESDRPQEYDQVKNKLFFYLECLLGLPKHTIS